MSRELQKLTKIYAVELYCNMAGHIPPARTIAAALNIGKTQANQYVIELYGRDPLDGAERLNTGPRPLPQRKLQNAA